MFRSEKSLRAGKNGSRQVDDGWQVMRLQTTFTSFIPFYRVAQKLTHLVLYLRLNLSDIDRFLKLISLSESGEHM